MTKDEALKLALKALRFARDDGYENEVSQQAITAIKQALALDKMAENARELGLDYEPCCKDQSCPKCKPAPVQPVAWMTQARNFVHVMEFTEAEAKLYGWIPVYTTPPAAAPVQEPDRVRECAQRLVEHADFRLGGVLSADSKAKDIPSKAVSQVKARHLASLRDALAATPPTAPVQEPLSELEKDAANLLFALHDAWPYVHQHCTIESKKKAIQALIVKHGEFADLHPPAAQRQWVGLTDEEKRQIFEREDYQGWLDYINAIEAKLKELNT
jgi:hypothetical protein